MNEGFVLLGEMDEVWAKMLMEVLKDNDIPCTYKPVFGFALSVKTGGTDVWKLYVPSEYEARARELSEELFSADGEEALEQLFSEEENEP